MEELNKIGNIDSIENSDQIGIKSDSAPFAECFYFNEVYDEKAIKRFIKNVERLIRSSREYSNYIEVLRTNCNALNHDNILHNITSGDVDLEFHHYPFSLYDIIQIVMNKHILNGDKFTSFSIAKEVLELHYKNMVGLVSLTKTMHELAHSGALFLSTKQIFGDYKTFTTLYSGCIPAELQLLLQDIENKSTADLPSDFGGLL